MTVVHLLEEIPAGTDILRNVRYLPDDAFTPYTEDELELAIRWLHAASYSASEGARRIARYLNTRPIGDDDTCESDSRPTAKNGTTGEHPKDAPPATDPASSSSNPRTSE